MPSVRRVRLWTGLVLFAYVTTHLANHALGLVSLLYGAFIALVQADAKRIVAYSSLSHLGLILLAVFVGTACGGASGSSASPSPGERTPISASRCAGLTAYRRRALLRSRPLPRV